MAKQQVYVAFYKHKVKVRTWQTFREWLIDTIIRMATKSKYSHCEVVFKAYTHNGSVFYDCYSSSPRDGGVRKKTMTLEPQKWDLINVDISSNRIKQTFKLYVGKPYDLLGAVGFYFGRQDKAKYFCSEYCAEMLKLDNTLISPQQLYEQLRKDKASD